MNPNNIQLLIFGAFGGLKNNIQQRLAQLHKDYQLAVDHLARILNFNGH